MMEIDLVEEIKKTERLGSCEVCRQTASKYTCPRCEIKTCSLSCSKIHKTELECDGLRDRTKYKPLKEMTTLDFMNDYYFLEEATRFTKDIACNKKVKNPTRLNFRFLRLRQECNKRDTKLYFVNNGLTRRLRNQSIFKAQEGTIYWHVELVFPNACNFTINKKFSENLKLKEIIQSVLDSEKEEKQLEFYRADLSKVRVLLKTEGLKKNNNRFYELNVKKTLKSNLKRKVLIEFPTIFVSLNHSTDGYDIVPSDDETIDNELQTYRRTLYEEVFSQKVGVNPPLVVEPEEVPIISEVINDTANLECPNQSPNAVEQRIKIEESALDKKVKVNDSDEEIQPANYFFSED